MKANEEAIIGLEICSTYECSGCPYLNSNRLCTDELIKGAFELAKRQRAELERLLQKLQQAKSEAIKEFAEKLKNKIWYSDWCNYERTITPEIITALVKEMTEEQE